MFRFTLLLIFLAHPARATLKADFGAFVSSYGESYGRQELKVRYHLFKTSRYAVLEHNSNKYRHWDMAVNQFSAMTPVEKAQHLGLLNETDSLDTGLRMEPAGAVLGSPDSVDNVALGFVTRPKDQRTCGSCWAFTAIAAFEGAYARATGVLKSFSEKELLDCTYSSRDGCKGGWYQNGWRYIGQHQHITALKDAPYDYAMDRDCKYAGHVENGMKNARYVNYATVARSDSELERAVARAVVAVAMIVEDDFYSYGSGVYDGCDTYKDCGHAVTMVGYAQNYWKVKNSWGRYWGESGYVRFSRGKNNNCRLADHAKFPVVEHSPKNEADQADPDTPRTREPNTGCTWGDDYPCSDMNCNYGCKDGTCWSQCNGVCGIVGSARCATCHEWCYLDASCSRHEDCSPHRYGPCNGACSL